MLTTKNTLLHPVCCFWPQVLITVTPNVVLCQIQRKKILACNLTLALLLYRWQQHWKYLGRSSAKMGITCVFFALVFGGGLVGGYDLADCCLHEAFYCFVCVWVRKVFRKFEGCSHWMPFCVKTTQMCHSLLHNCCCCVELYEEFWRWGLSIEPCKHKKL